jgi:uncharacterized protein (DUF305 family)
MSFLLHDCGPSFRAALGAAWPRRCRSLARGVGQRLTGVQQARVDSIRRPYTAADIAFMSGMIAHHAQAVKMAVGRRTARASRCNLCGRIALGQTAEIGFAGVAEGPESACTRSRRARRKMMMGGMEHMVTMPGMLTDAQMAQLDSARGVEFDRLFMTYMIQHHRGAMRWWIRSSTHPCGSGRNRIQVRE